MRCLGIVMAVALVAASCSSGKRAVAGEESAMRSTMSLRGASEQVSWGSRMASIVLVADTLGAVIAADSVTLRSGGAVVHNPRLSMAAVHPRLAVTHVDSGGNDRRVAVERSDSVSSSHKTHSETECAPSPGRRRMWVLLMVAAVVATAALALRLRRRG